ncbi:recombinase [Candidatus Bathyarchaeota archaeon]|nr:recombinase [Candidatus Bathyarchaeota archaeon]
MEIKQKELLSVGIDVGTTTSHLVFSKLVLQNDPFSRSNKYVIAERRVVYKGKIFLTPLKPGNREIDLDTLVVLLRGEYDDAGISLSDVETGAVIITGESARKENAEKIVEQLSREGGRFVAATAGPNFEAVISAYGAGAVEYSKLNRCRLIHSDTGGGTSNIAVIDSGNIVATACVNIGGRLIAYNQNMEITRLEEAGRLLLRETGRNGEMGEKISVEALDEVSRVMASTLVDVLTGAPETELSKALMMTKSLPSEYFRGEVHHSFSGGVAEYIYGYEARSYGDLGDRLGRRIRAALDKSGLRLVALPERIRATVIGASSYTLEVSGPTTFTSPGFKLPLRNIPVTSPQIEKDRLSVSYVENQVRTALKKIDLDDEHSPTALAFRDPVKMDYENLKVFARGVAAALPGRSGSDVPLVLIFETDVGNSVGNVLARETGLANVLAIDEISLKEGDFIDVGEPINEGVTYPVVVKSLVFN